MAGLFKALAAQWDLKVGRFKAFYAVSDRDVEGCIQVLDEVRRKELNRVAGKSVIDSHAFSGQELSYKLVACKDTKTGKIIGCMRITNALETKAIESSREEYLLDKFDDEMLDRMNIFTRLVVLKAYRRSAAALVIMGYSFAKTLDENGYAVLMSCEPSLFPMYKRLGMRPIGTMHNSPSGGYRIPMICIPDLPYLRKVKSPGLQVLKQVNFKKYEKVVQWCNEEILKNDQIKTGATFFNNNESEFDGHQILTQGLSVKGVRVFLKNAVVLECKKGDVLIAKDDGGKTFGFVQKGRVCVDVGQKKVLLNKGDIFGEIAYVLGVKRSAKVLADSDETCVVLLSVSAIERLANQADQMIVWRNLTRILAQRVINTSQLLETV